MSTNAVQGVTVKLRVVFHHNEDGPGYWAEVPGFPGCLTEGVTLDGNHSLAGQDLIFDIEMTDQRDATAEELSHGHAHDGDGHHHHLGR